MSRSGFSRILIIFPIMLSASVIHAEPEGGIQYSGSGFLTVAAGKMLSGTSGNVEGYDCPCYLSDYAQDGVYDGRSGLQFQPDTKLGLQGSAAYNDFSITAQVVGRGATGTADLEWLYGSYRLNDKITIQAGRKRLPMFYYSDVQDIGFVLPWVHLPSGPYGWEAVNYNGVDLRYQDRWGAWSVTADLLAGNESNNDSGYWKIYNGRQSQSSIKWSNIVGTELTLSNDWLEARAVYIQSNTEETLTSNGWDSTSQTYSSPSGVLYPPAKQQIYGLAINSDYQNWLIRSEFIVIVHPGLNYMDHAQLFGVGYHYGKWQPMATWSEYIGTVVTNGVLPTVTATTYYNMQQTVSLTVKYDLTDTSDLKLQFDDQTDHSDSSFSPNFGNAQLLTLAYDRVF